MKNAILIGAAKDMSIDISGGRLNLENLAAFVDGCDVVIRLNDIKNRESVGIGTKTDILGIMNCGKPSQRYSSKRINFGPTSRPDEVVFMVSNAEMPEMRRSRRKNSDPFHGVNAARSILARQGWECLPNSYVNPILQMNLTRMIRRASGSSAMTSAGLRMICHLLTTSRFASHSVFVAGFTFQGWNGHAFSTESALVQKWRDEGRIFIPPTPK